MSVYIPPTAVVDEGAQIGEGTKVWHFSHVEGTAVHLKAAVTNTYHAKGEIVLGCEKVLMDTDGNVLPLEEGQFTFVLQAEGDTGVFEAAGATNDSEGKVFFETFVFDENDVGEHTYLLLERNDGKAGYEYSEDEHTFVVTVTDNGDGTLNVTAPFRPEDYTFINVFIGTTDIPVEKVWQDEEDKMGLRPDSITVELYRNKEKQEATVILSDENEWKASFEDLPLYDENGAEYFYELKEVPVANYSGSVAVEDGVTVFTNTLDTQGTLVVTKTEKGNDAAIGTQAFDFTVTLTENDVPYMIFCHEWLQTVDGEMCVIELSSDLKLAVSKPRILFKASESGWAIRNNGDGYVTDGPFLHRINDGKLIMIWSSFGNDGYFVSVLKSDNGEIDGNQIEHNIEYHEKNSSFECDSFFCRSDYVFCIGTCAEACQAWESVLKLIRDGVLEAGSEGFMLNVPKK